MVLWLGGTATREPRARPSNPTPPPPWEWKRNPLFAKCRTPSLLFQQPQLLSPLEQGVLKHESRRTGPGQPGEQERRAWSQELIATVWREVPGGHLEPWGGEGGSPGRGAAPDRVGSCLRPAHAHLWAPPCQVAGLGSGATSRTVIVNVSHDPGPHGALCTQAQICAQ